MNNIYPLLQFTEDPVAEFMAICLGEMCKEDKSVSEMAFWVMTGKQKSYVMCYCPTNDTTVNAMVHYVLLRQIFLGDSFNISAQLLPKINVTLIQSNFILHFALICRHSFN